MSVYRWLGLESVKIGLSSITSAIDGATAAVTMPSSLDEVNNIVPDSCRILIEAPDDVEIMVEDSPDPDIILTNGSLVKTVEFATRDMDTAIIMGLAFGGTTGATLFLFPTESTGFNPKSLELVTEVVNGFQFTVQIPKANLKAGAELRMYNTNPDTGEIGFSAKVMKATAPGGTLVAPMRILRHS